MIDPQAVVKLGAGSGVVNSVPRREGAEEFSIAASAVPSFSHGRSTSFSQALDVMRLQ